MPYKLKELKSHKFQVINKDTGKVHTKGSSRQDAISQMRLLYLIEARKKRGLKK